MASPITQMHGHAVRQNEDPALNIRYLYFSETRGVFLGEGVWSYDEAAFKHECAFSYAPDTFEADKEFLKKKFDVSDVIRVECHPDMTHNLCSVEAAANAGLPRWEIDPERQAKVAKHLKK